MVSPCCPFKRLGESLLAEIGIFRFFPDPTKQTQRDFKILCGLLCFVSVCSFLFFVPFLYIQVIMCTAVHAQKVCLWSNSPFFFYNIPPLFPKSSACINKILFSLPPPKPPSSRYNGFFWAGGGHGRIFTTVGPSFQHGTSVRLIGTRINQPAVPSALLL